MAHSDINHSGCQKLCTQDYLLYLLHHKCIIPQRRRRGKKNKTEHCPDVGQNRHVFAFMFWNLRCIVATLVQGISHITTPHLLLLFLNSATFYLSLPPTLWSKSPLLHRMVQIFLYLSVFLHFPHLYPNVAHIYAIFLPLFFSTGLSQLSSLWPGAVCSVLQQLTLHFTLHDK